MTPLARRELFAGASDVVFRGRTNDCLWTLYAKVTGRGGRGLLTLLSRNGQILSQLLVGTSPSAPPLQLRSFTCNDPRPGTLVFGLVGPRVADIRWNKTTGPSETGPPDCVRSPFPEGFCLLLNDTIGLSETIAYDANGIEIGRQSFG